MCVKREGASRPAADAEAVSRLSAKPRVLFLKNPIRMGYCDPVPTIHRQGGFAFVVYTHDHEPPLVHVSRAGLEAEISLGDDETAPFVIDPKGMAASDIRRAVRIVEANQDAFMAAWRKHHAEVEPPDRC
jgi:hypothetical protein